MQLGNLGVFLILIPLVIYLISVFLIPRGIFQHPDDFFIAYRKVESNPFSNSSIAYGFQVATLYPFLVWAVSNRILVPFLNAVFWGVGIILFAYLLPKIREFINSDKTLHGFLEMKYKSSQIRRATAILTIIGLWGLALAEIFWGSRILKPIIGDEKLILYFIMFFMTFYVLLYVSYGGQIASILSDQYQLFFSCIGIFGLLMYLLYTLKSKNINLNFSASVSLIFFLISIPLIILGRFFTLSNGGNRNGGKRNLIIIILSYIINIILRLTLIVLFCLTLVNIKNINFRDLKEVVNLQGFGYAGLISLILLPLFWQFVDMTNWQRILSIKSSQENIVKSVKRGLIVYGIGSSFTWIIILPLGTILALTLPEVVKGDVFVELPRYLISSSSFLDKLMGYLFIISVIAIMLSTVDSIITAIMFAFVYDVWKPTSKIIDEGNREKIIENTPKIIFIGRMFAIIMLIIGLILFVGFDYLLSKGPDFLGVLFAFYTAQLSFMPAVLGAMVLKKLPSTSFVFVSILIGAGIGIPLGLYATLFNIDFQWYPIIVTLICSSLVYFSGILIGILKR